MRKLLIGLQRRGYIENLQREHNLYRLSMHLEVRIVPFSRVAELEMECLRKIRISEEHCFNGLQLEQSVVFLTRKKCRMRFDLDTAKKRLWSYPKLVRFYVKWRILIWRNYRTF